jgi:hypothetical protein
MSRKDYIEFAKLCARFYHHFSSDEAFRAFVDEFCVLLKRDNWKFDKDLFYIKTYEEISNCNS